LSYTEYADYLWNIHPGSKLKFQRSMVLDWAWETYRTSQKVYDSFNEASDPYRYNFLYVSLLESRLSLAGEHLAAVLNYIYGGK